MQAATRHLCPLSRARDLELPRADDPGAALRGHFWRPRRADSAGNVHVTWVAVHGGGLYLPPWLQVVLVTLAIIVLTATIAIVLARRTRWWQPGGHATPSPSAT